MKNKEKNQAHEELSWSSLMPNNQTGKLNYNFMSKKIMSYIKLYVEISSFTEVLLIIAITAGLMHCNLQV